MGYVCNTYLGVTPYPIDIVRMFNFSSEIGKRIVQSPLTDLSAQIKTSLQTGKLEETHNIASQSNEEMASICLPPNSVNMEETNLSSEKGISEISETAASPVVKAYKASKAGESTKRGNEVVERKWIFKPLAAWENGNRIANIRTLAT